MGVNHPPGIDQVMEDAIITVHAKVQMARRGIMESQVREYCVGGKKSSPSVLEELSYKV